MDSIRETMDRIHGLFEKHGRKLMLGGPMVPLACARQERPIRTYTAEQKAAAVALLREGKMPVAVASALGIPGSTVAKWGHQAGMRWQQGRHRAHPMRARGAELIRAGWRNLEIAEELRISVTTVSNWRLMVAREDAAARVASGGEALA